MITIKEDGADRTAGQLQVIKSGLLPEIGGQMEFVGLPVEQAVRAYPPEVPGSPYERTFNYLNSIQVKTTSLGGAAKWELTQGASYSPYLRDDDEQAPVHVGRWETVKQIVGRLESVVVQRVVQVVEVFIRRVMGG